MKKLLLAGVVLLAITTGPILAGETNWTGFYLGLNSGYSFGRSDAHYTDPSFRAYPINSTPDGWSVGMQGGANYQLTNGALNHVVLGFEVEFSYLHVSDTIYDQASDAHGRPGNTIDTSSEYAGTLRARLGYAVGRFLPYLTAGGAGADAEVSANDG
jgi:outer membrane immunogenic protein